MVLGSTQQCLSELIGQCAFDSSENALLEKNASFPHNSWQKSVFKHSLLLNKMQSVFPCGHFCVDNNRKTKENIQAYCVFTWGARRIMHAGLVGLGFSMESFKSTRLCSTSTGKSFIIWRVQRSKSYLL